MLDRLEAEVMGKPTTFMDMHDQITQAHLPPHYAAAAALATRLDFTMPSDLYIGSLLRTLVASKPAAHVLELGSGVGLSLSWMVDGLGPTGSAVSVDNDPKLIKLVSEGFDGDDRVTLVCEDGGAWLEGYRGASFDLIFADAWPGKYSHLDEALALLKPSGFYVIDDMSEQPNWPAGHADKVTQLLADLDVRDDLVSTRMAWSTGVVVAVKR